MRLIDADQFGVVSFQGKNEDFIEGALFILDKIYEAPTVRERLHGGKKEIITCDICGRECSDDYGDTYASIHICSEDIVIGQNNFCLACYSRMRNTLN